MNRLSTLLLGIFLVLLVAVDRGQAADPIREKLDKAKTTFDEGMKKAQVEAKKEFDDREAKARKVGKKELVDKILEERKAFEETGALTDNASPKLRKMVTAQRTAIEAAYDEAIKKYTMQKKDDLATAVVKEKEELQNKAVVLGAKVIPHQKAAEALHPHVTLGIQLAVGGSSGNTLFIKKDEPLPSGGFVITQLMFDNRDPLPPTFVDDILLPSLAEIDTVTHLSTFGRTGLMLTEDQVRRLAELPTAKALTDFNSLMELTPGTITALKRMPRLRSLRCSAKSADEALLVRLNELPLLRDLQLDNLGEIGTVTRKGLNGITALPLISFGLFYSPALDRDMVRRLPKIPQLSFITFWGSPIIDDDLKELAQCRQLQVLNLTSTKITDEGLAHLAKSTSITVLGLGGTQVTDNGLLQIAKIRTLKRPGLQQTKTTKAGWDKLAATRPDLTIELDGGTIEPKKK
jgi:ribosomal protein L9